MENKGLRFNKGKLKWSLVSWKSLSLMVQVLMYGAHKYSTFKTKSGEFVTGDEVTVEESNGMELISSGANNWKGGLKYSELCESLLRHTFQFLEGEDTDGESKLSHVGHILCNAMFLSFMFLFRKDLDDRNTFDFDNLKESEDD